jgi:hypothetical protein
MRTALQPPEFSKSPDWPALSGDGQIPPGLKKGEEAVPPPFVAKGLREENLLYEPGIKMQPEFVQP